MKLKISFGEGGVKQFLVRHVEKFVFGFALLLLLVLFWLGYGLQGFDQEPTGLDKLITDAGSHITTDSSSDLLVDREPKVDYARKVDEGWTGSDASRYVQPKPWEPPMRAQRSKRKDPTLYSAMRIELTPVTAALALAATPDQKDVTVDDPPAAVREPPKKKATAEKKRGRRGRKGGGGAEGGMEGMEGMPDPAMAMDNMADPSMGGGAGPGGGGGGGGGGASSQGSRRLNPDYYEGFKASTGDCIPVSHSFVAVTALAPYEKQTQEYERTLLNAAGFDIRRDLPRYVFFVAQRADVTDNPTGPIDESAWKLATSYNKAQREMANWRGALPEICDPLHLDPMLSMVAPPVLFHRVESFLAHSESPLRVLPANAGGKANDQASQTGAAKPEEPQPSDDLPGAIGKRFGANRFQGSGGMGPEGGADPAMDAAMNPAMQQGGNPGGGNMMSTRLAMPMTQYKLVRFFDFDVKPGRLYRYRIQLYLEDPNHPENPAAEPLGQTLDEAVAKRLEAVKAKEKELGQRVFYVTTEWSEPSDIVSIPSPNRVIAGSVTPAQTAAISSAEREYQTREPQGAVVPVFWDPERAVHVAIQREVSRGSVLNFSTKDVEYAHPVNLQIKSPLGAEPKEYSVQTDIMIADLRGGEELPGGASGKPLRALGEFAVLRPDGTIAVRDELNDDEEFRRYSFATPEEEAAAAPSGGGGGQEGGAGNAMMGMP